MAASSVGPRGAVARSAALPIVLAGVVLLLLVLAGGVYLYDHSRRDLIANGVRIDGVPVGGLREAAARTKVERDVVSRLNQHVTGRRARRSGRSTRSRRM